MNGTKTPFQSLTVLSALAGIVILVANAVLGTHFGVSDQTTITNGLTDIVAAVAFVAAIAGRFKATKAIGYVASDPVTAADIGKEVAQAISSIIAAKTDSAASNTASPPANG